MKLLQRLNNKHGMSLVEVLAALVVFVIGILTVVRIFPGGFFAVRSSENLTVASRLGQAEIERWKANAANIPAGIIALNPNGSVNTGQDPEDLSDGVNSYYSDVNKFRHIYEEAVKIPAPTTVDATLWGNSECSIYVLGFSPLADPSQIIVKGGPMLRRPLLRDRQDLYFRNDNEYAIDYSTADGDGESAKIYVKPCDYARTFSITYSYWETDTYGRPTLQTIPNIEITVAAFTQTPLPAWVSVDIPISGTSNLVDAPGFIGMEYGSESLHRKFDEITGTWDPENPYEYKLDATNPNLGVLAFNPAGYGATELTARGRQPLTAYIDYDVQDWHIIREDKKVPDAGTATLPVKLSLRFLKAMDSTQEADGTPYAGLCAAIPVDVLAVDLDTGISYAFPGGTAFKVDYKDGIIRFEPAFAGHTFRIYYKADGDWAVQVYKAYEAYYPVYGPGSVDYRSYFFDSSSKRVCVPRCYAGMSVAVNYSYKLDEDKATEKTLFESGKALQISDKSDPAGTGLYYADLTLPSGATSVRVSSVYGVSMGTRVIWRDSGKGLRAGQWKKVDLQEYLTRSSIY